MNAPSQTVVPQGRVRMAPHPSLRPFVVEYWGLARDLGAMGGFTITPDCFGELICCADEMFAVVEGGQEKLPTSFLVGLLDGPLRIEAPGVVRCIAARLQPWAVGPLTGIEAASPLRGWSNAESLFGPRLALASEMVGRCEWANLAPLFDAMLIEVISTWNYGEADIEVTGPFLGARPRSTANVAHNLQMTGRQIERRVRRLTRMSPKQLACLSRFQRVRDAIWANPSIDLARLAIETGYADQPHMTRQFRRYAGQTPTQFARSSAAQKNGLTGQDVAFVQERAGSDG